MIRTTCLAASIVASLALPAHSASATTTVGGKISAILAALHGGSSFAPGSLTFSIVQGGTTQTLFSGIQGVRAFNDLGTLNGWVNGYGSSAGSGSGYQFTHSVIGSYFGSPAPAPAPTPAPSVFDGGPYQFTHSVVDSYFAAPPAQDAPVAAAVRLAAPLASPPQPLAAPVPEPASWALMIGGFALAGAALRHRTAPARYA